VSSGFWKFWYEIFYIFFFFLKGHTGVIRCLKADSQKILSCSDDKTIKIWNIETGERYVTLRNHTDGVTCLQFNDYYILSGSYDRTIKLWDFSI
jgi:F-box/WD-40 domain protein 7